MIIDKEEQTISSEEHILYLFAKDASLARLWHAECSILNTALKKLLLSCDNAIALAIALLCQCIKLYLLKDNNAQIC